MPCDEGTHCILGRRDCGRARRCLIRLVPLYRWRSCGGSGANLWVQRRFRCLTVDRGNLLFPAGRAIVFASSTVSSPALAASVGRALGRRRAGYCAFADSGRAVSHKVTNVALASKPDTMTANDPERTLRQLISAAR